MSVCQKFNAAVDYVGGMLGVMMFFNEKKK